MNELKSPKYWEKMSIEAELDSKRKARRFSKLKRYTIKSPTKNITNINREKIHPDIIKKIDSILK